MKTKTKALRVESLSRPAAICLLRERLTALCREGECACAATARLDVFCGGFRALTDRELRERFHDRALPAERLARRAGELASLYHRGRQEVDGATLCCDVETRDHCACDGWNRFDNLALEGAVLELTGRHVVVG